MIKENWLPTHLKISIPKRSHMRARFIALVLDFYSKTRLDCGSNVHSSMRSPSWRIRHLSILQITDHRSHRRTTPIQMNKHGICSAACSCYIFRPRHLTTLEPANSLYFFCSAAHTDKSRCINSYM